MPWKLRLRIAALVVGAVMAVPLSDAWAAPPPNDSATHATVISALPFNDVQNTTEASLDADDAAVGALCGVEPGAGFSNSVWYTYTPSANQTITISTGGSDYSVAGAIVAGSPGAFLAVPGGCFLGGAVVQVTAGTTYYIDLLQFGAGSGGTLQVAISEAISPNPVLTLDAEGTFSKAGSATLTGTVSCTAGSSAFITATLRQTVGRVSTVTGSTDAFGEFIACDGTAQALTLTITPFSGLFRGGKALATVSVLACNQFTCNFTEVTRTVLLRR